MLGQQLPLSGPHARRPPRTHLGRLRNTKYKIRIARRLGRKARPSNKKAGGHWAPREQPGSSRPCRNTRPAPAPGPGTPMRKALKTTKPVTVMPGRLVPKDSCQKERRARRSEIKERLVTGDVTRAMSAPTSTSDSRPNSPGSAKRKPSGGPGQQGV